MLKFNYGGTSLRRTPLGPIKLVHYREGVLWSGFFYTFCGLYLGFSKCPYRPIIAQIGEEHSQMFDERVLNQFLLDKSRMAPVASQVSTILYRPL